MLGRFAFVAVFAVASPVGADEPTNGCMPRADMAKALADGWGEKSAFQGLQSDGQRIVEIFVRQDGTWTAVVVSADGTACPVAAGDQWIGFRVIAGVDG